MVITVMALDASFHRVTPESVRGAAACAFVRAGHRHAKARIRPCVREYDVALQVEAQIQRIGKELLHRETKTPTSDAGLPLPPICAVALRQRYLDRVREQDDAGPLWRGIPLMFTTRFGHSDRAQRDVVHNSRRVVRIVRAVKFDLVLRKSHRGALGCGAWPGSANSPRTAESAVRPDPQP